MKQKSAKNMLALLLTGTMMAACLSGCGETTQKETKEQPGENKEQEKVDDEITVDEFAGTKLTIAIVQHASDKVGNYDEKPIVKKAEEETGIEIEWIVMEPAVAGERLNVMLASDDQPDAYMGMIGTGRLSKNAEMFYDVSDLLEKYAPDVYDDYVNGGQNVLDMLTLSDGSIRSFVGNVGTEWSSCASGMWYINKAWLDQIGKDIPTTSDELYEVLCAFRDNDMNGNGDKTDELPMSFCENEWSACFMNYANAFGIGASNESSYNALTTVKDGIVSGQVHTENYKAFLEYYHKLAEEKLLDIEGFSQTTEQYYSKLAENRVGIFIAWDPSSTGTPEDYVAMAPFQALEDVKPVKTGTQNYFFGQLDALVPSADCENIEALLHWWNYISSSTENKLMARKGEENIGWHVNEAGELKMGPLVTEEGLNYTELAYAGAIGNTTAPYFTPEEVENVSEIDYTTTRNQGVSLVWDMLGTEYIGNKIINADAATERTLLEADLLPIISNFRANSVVDGITEDSWNEYLEMLEEYQYDKWIDWWQRYVDGEF